MPRKVFDIKDFKYGVISSVDEEDIPPEAASDSLNVDGDVGEGILQGIPVDIELTVASASIAYIRQGEFIEHDGIYDLIYHDAQNDTISVITDFYGTTYQKKLNIISSLSSDNVTMVQNGQEVHIGIDGAVGYWIGRMDHGLFSLATSWAIASIADSGTSPGTIEITTTPTHSLKNGDIVKISGATGTDSASINGIWIISAINNFAKTFELTGSTYTGTTLTLPGTAELYLTYEVGHCPASISDSDGGFLAADGAENAADGYFQAGIYRSWALSLTYDGYQESPLVQVNSDVTTAEANYYPITITAYRATVTTGADPGGNSDGIASFNKRITAVNLYRADSSDGTRGNIGLYRLVCSVDINHASWATATNDKTFLVWDYGYSYSFDTGTTILPVNPVTYTDNSGIPEELSDPTLYYALSTSGNGYQFVTKCTQSTLAGVETRRIFRSKYLRYDMFDYYTDFLVMPEPVTALKFYDGKLWAFSLNKTYRVNPDGLYIEDIYDDAGCQGQRAVHTNEFGMFFGNTENAWMYNGQFYRIGDAIRQASGGGKSWQKFLFTTLTDLVVTSDAKKGYVLFINERTDSTAKLFAWAYHPIKKRWDAFSFGGYATSANAGVFKGRNGEVYLSYATATQKLMRHTTNRQLWEWFSQELSFGETRQKKSITMIKIDATGTVVITYGVDGATPATSGTNEALINVYNKTLRIKLNAAAATSTNYVDSMEIIYRPLVGSR